MQVAQVADAHDAQLYVVGGAVRSVIQVEPITDLDVAMNGDMAAIGPAIALRLGTTIIQRSAFDTATLAMPDAVIHQTGIAYIDIVPLRTETYVHPGALPVVTPTDAIVVDLGRRDLTVNAMAIAFRPQDAMPLYDPFAGHADLIHQRARILHPLSFIDDPTRIVRMARLMVRLGLTMDTTTRRALRWAVSSGVLLRVSRQRWIQELQRTLDEAEPHAVLTLLRRWGVLMHIDRAFTHGVHAGVAQLATEWRILALLWQAPLVHLAAFMMRWHEAPKPMRGLVLLRQTRRQWHRLATAAPSRIALYLRQFDRRLLQQIGLMEPLLAQLVQRVDGAQAVMTPMYVRGGDLIRMGVSAGPLVGHLLQALNDVLLDGTNDLATYDAQIDWLKGHVLWRQG
jgi:tRNA nucleotidyltransferase (CCA-adding enzyme)